MNLDFKGDLPDRKPAHRYAKLGYVICFSKKETNDGKHWILHPMRVGGAESDLLFGIFRNQKGK
jgi:hypothetical protein